MQIRRILDDRTTRRLISISISEMNTLLFFTKQSSSDETNNTDLQNKVAFYRYVPFQMFANVGLHALYISNVIQTM